VESVIKEEVSPSVFHLYYLHFWGRTLQITVRLCYEKTHGVALSIGTEDVVVGDQFCGDSHMFVRGYGMGMGI